MQLQGSARLFAQGLLACGGVLFAATPGKVDFRTEILPIFKNNCVGCHGPSRQMNGFRLDHRRDAMRGANTPAIGPGNGAGSRLYLRVAGSQFGLRMPPTGPLPDEQISLIKRWIDEGAEWPDDVSGETPAPPPDAAASQMMTAMRLGEPITFQRILREHPESANRRGAGGNTPLMYAALYGDANSVRLLLTAGADANLSNEAGATALMWAVESAEKIRLLLEHKADPNGRSMNGRTALLIVASQAGSEDVVKLLLDAGANANFSGVGGKTPLGDAAAVGNEKVFRMLLAHGAEAKNVSSSSLWLAYEKCRYCFDVLVKAVPIDVRIAAAFQSVPPRDDARATKMFLDHGVSPNATDGPGRTLLMNAASSDEMPVETVTAFLEHGANVNARTAKGATAYDFARLRGDTPVAKLLASAGAKASEAPAADVFSPSPAPTVRAAIERSLPLLQEADVTFLRKAGCLSCHNNNLTMMSIATARSHGISVNEQMAAAQLDATVKLLDDWRDRVLQGIPIPGDVDTIGYVLVALADAKHAPDEDTDALARFLKMHQQPDGSWRLFAYRPPLESSEIEVAAAALRSLQAYAPKPQREEYEQAVRRAAAWLGQARPRNNEDRAFQILGLKWAGAKTGANKDTLEKLARGIVTDQRSDGGWAQLPTLASDAYATGQALYALHESGISVNSKVYRRGVEYLRTRQLQDGSWHVSTRALPVQPYFESDFPHGVDQFISAAATNWALLAMMPAAR